MRQTAVPVELSEASPVQIAVRELEQRLIGNHAVGTSSNARVAEEKYAAEIARRNCEDES